MNPKHHSREPILDPLIKQSTTNKLSELIRAGIVYNSEKGMTSE
jgi:hypothetical protein